MDESKEDLKRKLEHETRLHQEKRLEVPRSRDPDKDLKKKL